MAILMDGCRCSQKMIYLRTATRISRPKFSINFPYVWLNFHLCSHVNICTRLFDDSAGCWGVTSLRKESGFIVRIHFNICIAHVRLYINFLTRHLLLQIVLRYIFQSSAGDAEEKLIFDREILLYRLFHHVCSKNLFD